MSEANGRERSGFVMFSFEVSAKERMARVGRLVTAHGTIRTPSFVPVGTYGAVKGLSVQDLSDAGSQVLIANTYHLHLLPGEDLISELGGLHRFMGWSGPLMTDSGGFQIFSLGAGREQGVGKVASVFPKEHDRGGHLRPKQHKPLVTVDDEGVTFVSYLDGSTHRFTPEGVMEIERKLGADMIFLLDECTSPLHDYAYTHAAMERTHRWALRVRDAFYQKSDDTQGLFGIVQGGTYRDLREHSAVFMVEQGFDGYGIGGALGESKEEMYEVVDSLVPFLPEDKPRHLLGIGEVEDIFEVVERGMDLFDCITPTSLAQTGTVLAKGRARFRMHLLNARFREDPRPIDKRCACPTCRNHSRAYLRHLFVAKEFLGIRLAAIHNMYFLESLMREIREAIEAGRFGALKREWEKE